VRGDEAAADIIAYKRANDPFPDQSAADQWFDEPQLESYRHLGHLMTDELIESVAPNRVPVAKLGDLFSDLDRKARQARRKADAQPPVLVRSRFGYRAAWRGGT